jgi:GTP pyrophosphokinase
VETETSCPPEIERRLDAMRASLAERGASAEALHAAHEAAALVGALTDDAPLALATLFDVAFAGQVDAEPAVSLAGDEVGAIAAQLAKLGDDALPGAWQPQRGLSAAQAEAIRKMLMAVVSDPRLVVARLAEQLVRLRRAKLGPAALRERLALETRDVFAPLANRLGVWQLKWELEDLAFRELEPDAYRRIAAALNERRADRERYIAALREELSRELARAGIDARVDGRPKHIYSIHRKMQRKDLTFEQVFDVRAVRILCRDVPQCYAALGLVHGRWAYVPEEFDDYIATPKDNAYRSIHTAVIGPEGRAIEVQIRTREMHEQAELGVAAHWRYKEGGTRDAGYARQIEWARRLLGPADAAADTPDVLERVRAELFSDRVYALTPKGEVVDLPRGATPLDFAYQLHTDLGHRCRGARVNGRIVPLTHALSTGEVVEILAAKAAAPSRDWLAPDQGYLVSPRSRAKVRAWFRRQHETDHRAAGRAAAEREFARLGVAAELLPRLVHELRLPDADTLYRQLGEGELAAAQLSQALERLQQPPGPRMPVRQRGPARRGAPVAIEGVGDLPVTLARCCAPVRPQPILGYVTLGRGVTVHRAACAGLSRMRSARPERVLECEWTDGEQARLPVELVVTAFDRRGLVRDLSDVLAAERISIDTLTTTTDRREGTATTRVRIAVGDLAQLARVLRRLGAVRNVIDARRSG